MLFRSAPRRLLATGLALSISLISSGAGIMAADASSPAVLQIADDVRPIESAAPLPALTPADGRTTVQTPSALQFVPAPSSPTGTPTSSAGAAVLRWRGRKPVAEAGTETALGEGAWQDKATKTRGVRIVSHDGPSDAFRDPFEDRLAQKPSPKKSVGTTTLAPKPEAPKLKLPPVTPADDAASKPRAAAPAEEPDMPALDLSTLDKEPAKPGLPAIPTPSSKETDVPPPMAPDVLEAPAAAPLERAQPAPKSDAPPPPPEDDEPPAPAKRPDQTGAPGTRPTPLNVPSPSIEPARPLEGDQRAAAKQRCDRLYNDRDCCEEEKKCETALEAVRNASIKKISLDISASFKPDADTLEEQQNARDNQLQQMPARQWRDRDGKVVADGRLTDIRNRRIEVTEANGHKALIPLGQLSLDDVCFLTAWWGVPSECTLGDERFAGRSWEPITMTWKASGLCHKPLYFEQVQLERYGHTVGPILESPLAGAHFFGSVLLLPYQTGIHPPHECQYALGYYRPGSCAPWLLPPFPVSIRGGLLQAGAVVGGIFLIP